MGDNVAEAQRAATHLGQVLVVDADDDTRALYGESFRLHGYEVVEASDGREALTSALTRPPMLVVTETSLPLIDGYALCDILRRDRATANVAILMITMGGDLREVARARCSGANAVLIKPVTPEKMLDEARRLLGSDEARRLSGGGEHGGASGAGMELAGRPQRAESRPGKRNSLSRSFARFSTTTPPETPPRLFCPSCDRPLTYERSHIGGVSDRFPERWDHYLCSACGTFQYRHRTRKLRRVS